MKVRLLFLSTTVLVAGAWAIFTGSKQVHECMLGVVSVMATMIFAVLVYRQELQGFDLRWRDALVLWRAPWYVVSGVGEILLVLARDLAGRPAESIFRVCGFRTAKKDPVQVTRRALAIAYSSIAPNFIVVGIDYSQSRMLFHQIRRSAVPRMTKDLGAEVGMPEGAPGDGAARGERAER